jgi:hypothetical protein
MRPALYEQLLGSSWLELAEPVRFAHITESTVRGDGRFRIEHGRSHAARILAWVLHLLRGSDAAETLLAITSDAEGERWRRTFGDRHLDTRSIKLATASSPNGSAPSSFAFASKRRRGASLFRQLDAALMVGSVSLRLPRSWAPRVDAREDPAGADRNTRPCQRRAARAWASPAVEPLRDGGGRATVGPARPLRGARASVRELAMETRDRRRRWTMIARRIDMVDSVWAVFA